MRAIDTVRLRPFHRDECFIQEVTRCSPKYCIYGIHQLSCFIEVKLRHSRNL